MTRCYQVMRLQKEKEQQLKERLGRNKQEHMAQQRAQDSAPPGTAPHAYKEDRALVTLAKDRALAAADAVVCARGAPPPPCADTDGDDAPCKIQPPPPTHPPSKHCRGGIQAGRVKPPPPPEPKPVKQSAAAIPVADHICISVRDSTTSDDSESELTDTETESSDSDDDFEDVEAVQFMESLHHVLQEQDEKKAAGGTADGAIQEEEEQEESGGGDGPVPRPVRSAPSAEEVAQKLRDAAMEHASIVAEKASADAAEAASARSQLVEELGQERFCGALYIIMESRRHTNTKVVNQCLSRAANNVLGGDVRRRLLLEAVAMCESYGMRSFDVPSRPAATKNQVPDVEKLVPVVSVAPAEVGGGGCAAVAGGRRDGGGHRQRLAGALEAAVADVGAAGGNGRGGPRRRY